MKKKIRNFIDKAYLSYFTEINSIIWHEHKVEDANFAPYLIKITCNMTTSDVNPFSQMWQNDSIVN